MVLARRRGPAFEDLTARARIRDAALRHFADDGFARATIREIARTAGVSPGLVRHHYGSKEALRDACDEHVSEVVHRVNDQIAAGSEAGDLGPATDARDELRQFHRYVMRSLLDGSTTAARLFDELVVMSEQWVAAADKGRPDPPDVDVRSRAAVLTAMAAGAALLHQHVSRATGIDMLSPEGDQRVALAMLDIYSHRLVTPELAATARAGLDKLPTDSTTTHPAEPRSATTRSNRHD